MNKRYILALVLAGLAAISIPTLSLIFSVSAQGNPYEAELIQLYKRVYRLGRDGINVTDIVRDLNTVLAYVREGDLDRAGQLLNDIDARVSDLEARSGGIIFWMNVRKYSVAAALISLPILAYIFIPRIYLEAWYRLRRRWRVKR